MKQTVMWKRLLDQLVQNKVPKKDKRWKEIPINFRRWYFKNVKTPEKYVPAKYNHRAERRTRISKVQNGSGQWPTS